MTSSSWSEEKHNHFNEQVEQYLALDETDNDEVASSRCDGYDRDSDDGAVMIKSAHPNRKFPVRPRSEVTSQNSCNLHSKTIATLQSIRLKDTEGTPEPSETVTKHSNGFQHSGRLSSPPAQEAIERSLPSTIQPNREQR
jgi:hypothetical protein